MICLAHRVRTEGARGLTKGSLVNVMQGLGAVLLEIMQSVTSPPARNTKLASKASLLQSSMGFPHKIKTSHLTAMMISITMTLSEIIVKVLLNHSSGLHIDAISSRGDCSAAGDVLRDQWGADWHTHLTGSRHFRRASGGKITSPITHTHNTVFPPPCS